MLTGSLLFSEKADGQTGKTRRCTTGGEGLQLGALEDRREVGRPERREQRVPPYGAYRRTVQRTTKNLTGMLLEAFEQGGSVIKTLLQKDNLAVLYERLKGAKIKEANSSGSIITVSSS